MCTVLVATGVSLGPASSSGRDGAYPLVVVANRDERLDREASPPRLWAQGFLAPRDEVAGGTWLGVNREGVFVGITNRFLGPRDDSRRSRGAIVVDALALPSARAIHQAMARLDPRAYNGFHLVYADGRDALATASDGAELTQVELGRGVHVLTERSFGAGDDGPRRARIARAWARLAADGDPEALTGLLAEHDERDPFASTCIHAPALGYGTRSAIVLALGGRRDESVMLWAEGPPCTTPFAPVAVPWVVPGPGETG